MLRCASCAVVLIVAICSQQFAAHQCTEDDDQYTASECSAWWPCDHHAAIAARYYCIPCEAHYAEHQKHHDVAQQLQKLAVHEDIQVLQVLPHLAVPAALLTAYCRAAWRNQRALRRP